MTAPEQPGTVVLIDHHDNPDDDVVNLWLERSHYDTRLLKPFRGDDPGVPGPEVAGTVIFGGERNVEDIGEYPYLRTEVDWILRCMERQIPVLGICLGGQLIAHALGANVEPMPDSTCEFGYYPVTPTTDGQSFIPEPMHVAQAHFQQFDLPRGATLLATGESDINQAFSFDSTTYALQFHPEVSPDIFRRWQHSDWAYHDHPGAQSMDEQTQLLEQHGTTQVDWLENFLGQLFPVLSAPTRHR